MIVEGKPDRQEQLMEAHEIAAELDSFNVPSSLRDLVRHAVETTDGLGGRALAWQKAQYVAVAADGDSSVAAYVSPSGISLVLEPDEAEAARLKHDYLVVDARNSQTVHLWAPRNVIEETNSSDVVQDLLERALIRSSSRAARARTAPGAPAPDPARPICPVHNMQMLGGECDLCT